MVIGFLARFLRLVSSAMRSPMCGLGLGFKPKAEISTASCVGVPERNSMHGSSQGPHMIPP